MARKLKRKYILVMENLSSLFFPQNMYPVLTLQRSQSNFTVLPSFLLSDAMLWISVFLSLCKLGCKFTTKREWPHPHILLGMDSITHCPPSHELTLSKTVLPDMENNIPACVLALQEQGQMMANANAYAFIVLYLLI